MSEIEWFEMRDFFSEYGCVWMDHPEMRWYEESWGALMRAGLADDNTDDDGEVLVKLRAICLLKMSLGFCACLDENDEPSLTDMLASLKINPIALADMIEEERFNKVSFKDIPDILEYKTFTMIKNENRAIYQCLKDHYGGDSLLFVSLWNSRVPLYAVESAQSILNEDIEFIGEKPRAFNYVTEGMSDW
jgi:hypothetical protein